MIQLSILLNFALSKRLLSVSFFSVAKMNLIKQLLKYAPDARKMLLINSNKKKTKITKHQRALI